MKKLSLPPERVCLEYTGQGYESDQITEESDEKAFELNAVDPKGVSRAFILLKPNYRLFPGISCEA